MMNDISEHLNVNLMDPGQEPSDEALAAVVKGMGKRAEERFSAAMVKLGMVKADPHGGVATVHSMPDGVDGGLEP